MSDNTEIECNSFKFIRFPHVSGFIAFDKNNASVGFDDVAKYIDSIEAQLARQTLTEINELKERDK